MKKFLSCVYLFIVALGISATAQPVNDHRYKVLFLGNSYTYVNNLPLITANAAASVGDTLVYDVNAIGGYTLQQQSQDVTSLGKIAVGNWDYVVLQEQSQLPSFPIEQVDTEVFPYAKILDSIVHHDNSCGRSIFYMTWGRASGDASNCAFWPPVCTYNGMDSMLYLRYMMMADSNNALVSPAGAVWHYIRDHYPTIQLYQSDESHPSEAGTYAAACTFYTTIFKRDPTRITYHFSLSDSDAAHIRLAAKLVVYDSLSKWHIGEYDATAQATYTVTGTQVAFTNTSAGATEYTWSFGDGNTSTLASPVNIYASNGVYTVTLVAINCGKSDTTQFIIPIGVTSAAQIQPGAGNIVISPNPAHNLLNVHSDVLISSQCDVQILNMLGQTVGRYKTNNTDNQKLDISELGSGVYLISISDAGRVIYRRSFLKN